MGANRHHDAVKHLLSYPMLTLISTLVGLTGILSVFEIWQKDRVAVWLMALFLMVFVSAAFFVKRRTSTEVLPEVSQWRLFHPFMAMLEEDISVRPDQLETTLIKRTSEVTEIVSAVEAADRRYIVVSGRSGVGKSILLKYGIRSGLRNATYILLDEYKTFVRDSALAIGEAAGNRPCGDDLQRTTKELIDAYEAYINQQIELSAWASTVSRFIMILDRSLADDERLIMVFDQAERLLHQVLKNSAYSGAREDNRLRAAIGAYLEALRGDPRIAVLFAIRSDAASQFISILCGFSGDSSVSVPEGVVRLMILNGVSTRTNYAAYITLSRKFSSLEPLTDFRHIERLLSLDEPVTSNTFMTELTGYMIEHFATTDPEMRSVLTNGDVQPPAILTKYFNILINGYSLQAANFDSRHEMSAVLYAIASENRASGNPLSVVDLAKLAHIPRESTQDCIEYLSKTGALAHNSSVAGREYRLVHDRLADHILTVGSDALVMRLDHREAISFLAGRSITEGSLILARPTDWVLDIGSSRRNLPQLVLIGMIAFCVTRLFFPEPIFHVLEPFNLWLDGVLPGAIQTYGYEGIFYLPIIVAQYLWVTFMYYLDRGYFSQVVPNQGVKGRSTRLLASSIAPVGGFLGCLLCFAPALFPLPIIVGGLGLTSLYFIHARSADVKGFAKANSVELGLKTLPNMVVAVAVIGALHRELNPATSSYAVSLVTIWLCAAAFVWFWFAMRNRQGSPEGWSSLLAIFDSGRMSGKDK